MKLSQPLMKLTIKILILMILFVILYLISVILYSVRYWPDVYNYINANITIKRIPTISELNLTVYEVAYTTEIYTTIEEDYAEASTEEGFDINIDEFTNFDDSKAIKGEVKRNIALEDMNKDYSELPKRNVIVDYVFLEEDTTTKLNEEISTELFMDSVDESKLTTRDSDDVEMVEKIEKEFAKIKKLSCDGSRTNTITDAVFPWIVTIFIKNDTNNNQFDYYCDGALLTEKAILTAARCVISSYKAVDAEDLLVVLGKRSLQSMGEHEKAFKIKYVKIHENFTNAAGRIENDLAILTMDENVIFSDFIQSSCLINGEFGKHIEMSATTAWRVTGELTPIYFEKQKSDLCGTENKVDNTFCATYGNDVALCPSYGGLYVTKLSNQQWFLQGILYGDPTERGVCYNKNVLYTSLQYYIGWITENANGLK